MTRLPDRARALLDAARHADDPSPAARARADQSVRAALSEHGLDLPPLAPHAGLTTGTSALGSSLAANAIKVAIAASVAGAIWLGMQSIDRVVPAPGPPAAAPTVQAPVVQSAMLPIPTSSTPPAETTALVPAPLGTTTAASEPESSERGPLPWRARNASRPGSALDVEAEVKLISRANALLTAGKTEQSLRVLAEHARRFPQGVLREERNALRVISHCNAHSEQARDERERFLRAAPDSVLSARVSAACSAADDGT